MLDQYPTQHYGKGDVRPDGGAVIVFHGGNVAHDLAADELNRWASGRPWCVFISIGDEGTDFPYERLERGKRRRLWVQTPKPGKVKADRYFIEGIPSDCRELLGAANGVARTLDWAYVGQINHERRYQMEQALLAYPHGPRAMVTTKSFWDAKGGLGRAEYYALMKQAKLVPCPAGLATPDSFRFAEALEAGCIPVLDACSLDGVKGYWEMVLGDGHPFVVIEDWSTFPEVAKRLLQPYTLSQMQKFTGHWWRSYKKRFDTWLAHDLASLGVK